MAGISNYYHGETARAVDRMWVADDDQLFYVVCLDDNPHRKYTLTYGSDILIDSIISPGDKVTYVRLSDTCGVWVREADAQYPQLDDAIDRSSLYHKDLRNWPFDVSTPSPLGNGGMLLRLARTAMGWPRRAVMRLFRSFKLKGLQRKTGISAKIIRSDQPVFELLNVSSGKQATFFLSYSSRNALMARQLHEDIIATADLDVWFDITKAANVPEHEKHIEEWLHRAVDKCRGFVVLLTKASIESTWVSKEIGWAAERTRADPEFRLIVLKLEDLLVPPTAAAHGHVIDGDGLWWSGGIVEELFAAVYGRRGRQAWLKEQDKLGKGSALRDREVFHYEDYASEAGIAQELQCYYLGGHFHWKLSYRRGNQVYVVSHSGMECTVDLDIKSGDRIAFFVCHRNARGRFMSGIPVWMRSNDLSITPASVIGNYMQRVPEEDRFRTLPRRAGEPPAIL